ncbi:hypothetical protein OH768_50895 [Streptomyces sp. NBC_01622]|uniref:hypothetical protein n=1 Tax=Streptomyces sp. NBC_01622 TaxID=2975903 RepID=UPI00386BFFFA|nr:hypothetical protein OH768_50895 [Streptomyces sp. NBC_01622]
MSAGHTARRSLRAGRVRIALGVTGAAAALAIGSSVTAHADNSAPAPKPVPSQVTHPGVCPEPEPVDAVPGGNDTTFKGKQVSYTFSSGDPVDAVPGNDCAVPVPDGGDPVDAVPGGNDTTPDHAAREAKPAPAER